MAITNPTKYVTVRRLERFKEKLDGVYATIKQAETLASAIGVETDIEFVDLGLPSGTLWAKCNIGAETETGYGNYYMYGKGATQYNSSDSAYSGTEDPLAAEADTATQVIGAPWHMPTEEQFDELIANTTYTWETNFNGSGINGGKFTAANGNYIFLPAGGYRSGNSQRDIGSRGSYWGSTPTNLLYFNDEENGVSGNNPVLGCSVRGVASPFALLTDVKGELNNRYTKSEVDTKLSGKSDTSHNHDSRYYQKSEVDDMIEDLEEKLEGPYYDDENRCIVFPDYEDAYYNQQTKGIYL